MSDTIYVHTQILIYIPVGYKLTVRPPKLEFFFGNPIKVFREFIFKHLGVRKYYQMLSWLAV